MTGVSYCELAFLQWVLLAFLAPTQVLLFPLRDSKDLMDVTAQTVQQLTLVELVEVMSARGYWQKLSRCPICGGSVRVNDIGRWTCYARHCEWPGQVVLHGSPFFVARGGVG